MNILKFYNWIKGLFNPKECKALPSCELEHMIFEPVVFEARDNDSWQYGNVIVAYKGLAGYLVYIHELDAFEANYPTELELSAHEGTVMCDVLGAGTLKTFLEQLFNGRSIRFGGLKEDS